MSAHGDDLKSKVLQATSLVDLVSQTVALKRRGKVYVGLCPFHQEKTPSFHVDPERQYYRCFGCKKSGNAIDFVIERDRVVFKEAMFQLAEKAGIPIPKFDGSTENANERKTLLEAQSAACMFFEKLLSHPQMGDAARKYLAERGFDAGSIARFHIGFAPDAWDGLLKSPAMKKFSPRELALAGLAKPREKGDGYYDTFRNRLMFPIRDEQSRVIAFGGRVMPGSEDPAKYLNSPETPLFSKSRCIFGLDLARAKIVETRTVAIVEGYTDVVMAHQYGVSNVVSPLGTALTPQHVAILRRFADRIVLLFDADTAGDAAVDRALALFLTEPVEIAIASLPDGLDPDELLLQQGADGFNRMLADAVDALTYKWKQLVKQMSGTDELTARQQAVQKYLETLGNARGVDGAVDPLRWGQALSRVSRLTEIPVEELNRRFKKKPALRPRKTASAALSGDSQAEAVGEPNNSARVGPLNARQRAESMILGILLQDPSRWNDVQQVMQPAAFTDENLRRLAEIYWQHQQDEGEPVFNEFLGLLDEGLKTVAIQCLEEARTATEPLVLLQASLEHLQQERQRGEERKLIAQLRRTSDETPNPAVDLAADIDALRQLQEKARKPDMKRVGL